MVTVDSTQPGLGPVLARHPFFAGLDTQTLDLLSGCAANMRFNPGDYTEQAHGQH